MVFGAVRSVFKALGVSVLRASHMKSWQLDVSVGLIMQFVHHPSASALSRFLEILNFLGARPRELPQ